MIDLLRDAARPGNLDVALRESVNEPGRMTFAWNEFGDLVFDDTASYAVLMAVLAHRGMYRADAAYGTLLYKVRRDKSTTGSQLAAYARDGLAQMEAAGIIATGATARAERVRPGRWRLRITWTANGAVRMQELSL